MKSIEKLNKALSDPNTSLLELKAIGWRIEANEGGRFFRHISQLTHPFPFWVTQTIASETKSAVEANQQQLRALLGLS